MVLTSQVQIPAADQQPGVKWPIGCFNRPWTPWTYDEAIEGIKDAGFGLTGILGEHIKEPFISSDATQPYLEMLRERIKKSGLAVNVAWLRTNHDMPLTDVIMDARKQVDHASFLDVKFLLTMGVDQVDMYGHYYQVMRDVAAYAADLGIRIVMKPHGGCSATATEMLQFGEGKVDFKGVFSQLRKFGFEGPVMVECCKGRSLTELESNAKANRLYLEHVFTAL